WLFSSQSARPASSQYLPPGSLSPLSAAPAAGGAALYKPETGTPTTRRYTEGYIRDQRKFEPSTSITLKGRWMAALGFETGQKIDVFAGPGQLIIRLAGEK
uniref:SymE family type I addiction module toxin n=1 Tax=Pantoea sp. IMH TaxID=1267600 RepID=UPI001F270259